MLFSEKNICSNKLDKWNLLLELGPRSEIDNNIAEKNDMTKKWMQGFGLTRILLIG